MNLQTFIDKREGKRYEEKKGFGYECVAPIKLLMETEYGVPKKKSGNANQIWYDTFKYMPRDWKRVSNIFGDKNQKPPVGSILITDNLSDNNPYGHIGIVTDSGDGVTFEMLNQNRLGGSNGLGQNAILKYRFDYINVLGWYEPPTSENDILLKKLIDDGIWNGVEGEGVTKRVALMIAKARYS